MEKSLVGAKVCQLEILSTSFIEVLFDNLRELNIDTFLRQNEFREYPPVLRHAVSVGRKLQDPVAEFAGLCVEEEELLCLKLHPLQVGLRATSLCTTNDTPHGKIAIARLVLIGLVKC